MTSRRVRRAALAAVLVLGACNGEETAPTRKAELPSGPEGYPPPDQVVENGQHVITVEGVRKAVLIAEQLYFFNQLGKVVGDTIQVSFYDEEGTYQSTLTARSGELEQSTQSMIAKGDVFVRGTDSTIRSEQLRYDPAANQVITESTTEIVQGGNVIRGRGVVADPGLENIRITGGSAVLRSEPDLGPEPAPPAADTTTATPPLPAPPTPDGAP